MSKRLWHFATKFPVPGVPLLVRTTNGTEHKAIRHSYALSYKSDPDYRELETNQLIKGVTQWAIL